MLRKWNRLLAILLAFALVTTTFGSDFASARVYAVEEIEDVEPEGGSDEGEAEMSDLSFAEPTEEVQEEASVVAEAEEERNDETPADGAPVDGTPAEETPAEETPAEETPAEPTEETPAEVDPTAPVEDKTAVDPANTVVDPDAAPADGEEILAGEEEEKLVKVTYSATEGGSVSSTSEEININDEEARFEGSTATADDGYIFVNWTDADGSEVSTSATFVPSGLEENASFTAVFEAEEEEPEQKLVKVTYKTERGGKLSVNSETIDLLDETAKFEGCTAEALNEAFEFVNWVDKDGKEVSAVPTFVPENIEEDATFTAVFKETEKITKFPKIERTNVHAGGLIVSLEAETGAFPEGTEVKINGISESQAMSTAQSELGDDVTAAVGVDITFYYTDEDGKKFEIQPASDTFVHVNLELETTIEGTEFTVLHDHGDSVEQIAADISTEDANSDPEDDTKVVTAVEFNVDEFSVFIVASKDEGIERKMITYTFVYGDDEAVFYEQTVKKGDTLNDPGIPPQVDNSVFIAWYVEGESTPIELPMVIESTDGYAKDEVKVVAQYKKIYYVTFHGVNGGRYTLKSAEAIGEEIPWVIVDDEEVAAPTNMQAFKGWSTVEGDPTKLIVKDESGHCRVNAKEVSDVYPVIVDAYWVHFDENDDTYIDVEGQDEPVKIGGGASYTGPQFLEYDDVFGKAKPENPTRNGYTFAGWSFDPEGNNMVAETGDRSWASLVQNVVEEGSNDITLYAQWTAVETTKFTIVVWKQKVTDRVGDTEKHYDFYQSDDTHTGRTGEQVPASSYASYQRLNMEGFYYAGMSITSNKTAAAGTIGPKGDTVVNIYYDRKIMHIVFGGTNSGTATENYVATTSENGTQYGYINGQYVQLERREETTYILWVIPVTEVYWYYNGTEYTGTRYTKQTTYGSLTYTGLFGQSLKYADDSYDWPEGKWKGQNDNVHVTFFSDFLFNGWEPDTTDTTTESTLYLTKETYNPGSSAKTIYYYVQQFGGIDDFNGYKQVNSVVVKNGTGFTMRGDYYTGFTPYKYKKGRNGSEDGLHAETEITIDKDTYLYFSRNKYSLTFFYNPIAGEPNTESKVVSDIYYQAGLGNYKAQAPIKDGAETAKYEFLGWYADDTLTQPFDWNNTMPAADVSVYAKWGEKICNVKIDFDGGTETVSTDFDVSYGEKVNKTALMNTVKEGWTLAGWVYAPDDTVSPGKNYNFDATVRNISIKAVWKRSGNVHVIYDAGEHGTNPPTDSEGYEVGSGVIVAIPPSVNDGWVFTGWKLGNKTYVPGEAFTITSSVVTDNKVTLVAVYEETIPSSPLEEELTSVLFMSNDGNDGVRTEYTVDKDDDGEDLRVNVGFTAPTVEQAGFAKTGYRFVGWDTDSSATTAKIPAGKKYVAADNDGTDNVLYAIWEVDPDQTYKAKYESADDTMGSVDPTVDAEASQVLGTANVNGSTATAKTGYAFDGWYKGNTKISDNEILTAEKAQENVDSTNGSYRETTVTAHF